MTSTTICKFCLKHIISGIIVDGNIICNKCNDTIKNCYKCQKKAFINDKCTKCHFEHKEIRCQTCDKMTNSGVLNYGIFSCSDCKENNDDRKAGLTQCPKCKKCKLETTYKPYNYIFKCKNYACYYMEKYEIKSI